MRIRALLLSISVLAIAGCPLGGADLSVEVKNQHFTVEIADNDEERMRGLMFRESMDADQGMLFIFDDTTPQAFWMRNTLIPLDIMYFDGDRKFVSAHYNVPTCKHGGERCPNYPSEGDARYVLELNAGVGAGLNLAPGDVIKLPKL